MTTTLEELRALAAAATPGPWRWFGNAKFGPFYLATTTGGRRTIMGFVRKGMTSAQPTFVVENTVRTGSELAIYEVAPAVTDPKDPAVYRHDITGFRSADAAFIAATDPTTILELIERNTYLEAVNDQNKAKPLWDALAERLAAVERELDACKRGALNDAAVNAYADVRLSHERIAELEREVQGWRDTCESWRISFEQQKARIAELEVNSD